MRAGSFSARVQRAPSVEDFVVVGWLPATTSLELIRCPMRFLLSLLLLSVSLLCMRSHATEPKQPASPIAANTSRLAAAPSDKAQVVFFRDSRFFGWAAFYTVHEGEHSMARLHNGEYFVSLLDPGAHKFEVRTTSNKSDALELKLEAGKTYFVMSTVTLGVPVARPHLMSSDEATFDKMAGHLHQVSAK